MVHWIDVMCFAEVQEPDFFCFWGLGDLTLDEIFLNVMEIL